MNKIIFFELKKVIKSTLFKVMTVGLTLFILAFYGLVYLNSEKNFERIVLGDENLVSNFQSIIQEIEDLIDLGRLNEGEIMAKKEEIKFLERIVKDAKARSDGYEQEDWKKVLDPTIEFDKQIVDEQEAFGSSNSALTRSLFTLKSNLEQNKLLRERNIKPVFPIDYSTTAYDIFDTAKDETLAKNMAKRYSPDGLYFQYTLVSLFFSVIGVSFFLFLFGDILTKEGFRDSGPIQLLYTQPVKRSKIIFGKMLLTVMTTIVILIVVIGLPLLIGSIFDRFGDRNYPLLIYGENETFTFMNLDVFLLKSLALFFMVLLFSYSLLFLFSVITKNTMASLGGAITVILVGIEMSAQPYLSAISPYLPFNYFRVNNIISMESAVVLDNFNLTFTNGLVTLAVFTLILWLTSNMLFRSAGKQS